jgi:hypothetical protein
MRKETGRGNRKRQNMERWRGMYVGMGMSFVGRRNEKGTGRGESEKAEHGMVRMDCAGRGNRKGRTGNRNDRTRNGRDKLKTLFKQKKLHARLFFKYYSLNPKI